MNKLFLILIFLNVGCTILPSYRVSKAEYCEKVGDTLYCDNGDVYDFEKKSFKCSFFDYEC